MLFLFLIVSLQLYSSTLNDIIDKTVRFNDWINAKIQLEDYLKSNASDSYAYSVYAEVLNNLKLYDQAISAEKNAITNEKNEEKKGEYYYNLGNYYYNKNVKDISLQMYEKSLSYNNMLAETYYNIGLINYENKDIDKCIENWKKYINLTSNMVKREKIQNVIALYEKKKIEEQQLAEAKRLKDEEERKRLEEEKRKKDEMLKDLLKELENDQQDSKSLEDSKIKKKKSDVEFEDIK
jgi:tetratricopeptide (TPR) repeat protein